MKFKIIFLVTFPLFLSCSKEFVDQDYINDHLSDVIVTYPESINQQAILPNVATYYKNISSLAKWYYDHPFFRYLPSPIMPSRQVNTVLDKLESISLLDSCGKSISFFDLEENDVQPFLDSWKTIESFEVSQKLKRDSSGISQILFAKRNIAFDEGFGKLKSVELEEEDPYFRIRSLMDIKEKDSLNFYHDFSTSKSGEYTDENFWNTVRINNRLAFSIFQFGPNVLSPQLFVDRLRPNLKKGRLIIALPGGWTTNNLMIFYPAKELFDAGHTAFVLKNSEEIPDSIDDQFNLTIGTALSRGCENEQLGSSWCYKHSMAFLCQLCLVQWEKYKNGNEQWSWKRVSYDIDNVDAVEEASKYIGTPYCNPAVVFLSKWAAPKSFICTSLAWYCVKETSGINISDWWDPSVFPRDLFFSENLRIIDDTLD